MAGDERRRHARVVRDVGEVRLRTRGSDAAFVVEVKDVGIGGVFVFVDPPPPLHEVVSVEMGGLRLAAQVVRVQRGGRERGVRLGAGVAVAFTDVDEATLNTLAAWLG